MGLVTLFGDWCSPNTNGKVSNQTLSSPKRSIQLEASKTHETSNFSHRDRTNLILNYLNLLVIYRYPFFSNHMLNKGNRGQLEVTLRKFILQFLFPQDGICMLLLSLGVNQNIIYKHNHKRIQEWFKHLIHQTHKWCRRISQPNWYHQKLIMPIPGPEGCLRYVFRANL